MRFVFTLTIGALLFSSISSASEQNLGSDAYPEQIKAMQILSEIFQNDVSEQSIQSMLSESDLNCQDNLPPGGWISFPLECRHFVGQLEIAADSNFRHILMTMQIEQLGRLKKNSSGEVEYYFSLKLGHVQMRSEKVVWQEDRSYQIGKKIRGLCTVENEFGAEKVVCRAGFHGILGRLVGGYVETYYGPGLNQIKLESSLSQEGRKPILNWRATLSKQ